MVYKIHTLEFRPDSFGVSPSVYIPDITSQGLEMAPEQRAEVTAGESSPTFVSTVAQKPVYDLAGYAIATMLDNFGAKGAAIDSDTNIGAKAYLESLDDLGDPLAGSVHRSLQFRKGVILPKTIEVDHRGDARLTCDLIILNKSGNDSVIIDDVAALPTIAIVSARWTLGPCQINGVALAKYDNFQIDFGNTVEPRGTQSDIYDTLIDVKTHAPTLTIKGVDPKWFATTPVPIGGKIATHANSDLTLRKRTQDGTGFVSNAVAEHIKFTFAGLVNIDSAFKGEATRLTETTIRIAAAKDVSGNDPLIIDTTSTHT